MIFIDSKLAMDEEVCKLWLQFKDENKEVQTVNKIIKICGATIKLKVI